MKKSAKVKSPAPERERHVQSEGGLVQFLRRRNWESFVMNLLAVILGIVITFAGEAWVKEREEHRDVNEALRLVRDELRENRATLCFLDQQTAKEGRAARYLSGYFGCYERCDRDSMVAYCNLPLSTSTAELSDDAMELLKSSSLFQKIEDKELALNIIEAYNMQKTEYNNYRLYYDKKKELVDKASQEEVSALFARTDFTAAEMWNAFSSTNEGRQFLNEISISVQMGFGHPEFTEAVDDVIERLDREIDK